MNFFYQSLLKKNRHLIILFFSLLIIYGCNPEFKANTSLISSYSAKSQSKEPFPPPTLHCSIANFRTCGGEPAYAAFLANGKKIPFIGGELDDKSIWLKMKKKDISLEDFLGFYIVRQVPQWKRERRINESAASLITLFINTTLSQLQEKPNIKTFYNWYIQNFHKDFNINKINEEDIAPNHNVKSYYIFNEINIIRDQYLANLIASSLNSYKKVMVIYGASHFVQQKRVLDTMFGKQPCTINYNLLKHAANVG